MLERKLLVRLVLPLTVLALVSIAVIRPPQLRDLLTNLVVEIAGILITVLFVDWILRNREKEKWQSADVQIRADFAALALRFLAESTLFLTDGGWQPPKVAKFAAQDKPWSLVLEHITPEEIHSAVTRSTQQEMATFAKGIQERIDDLIRQHARYSIRLSPEETDAILQLEGALRGLKTELSLLQDDSNLLDLADEEDDVQDLTARHTRRASEELQQAISHSIGVFGRAFPKSR